MKALLLKDFYMTLNIAKRFFNNNYLFHSSNFRRGQYVFRDISGNFGRNDSCYTARI